MHQTYQKILHFIKYHNAVTIVFVMVFFGFGVSYAASPAVRDSVYSSTETVVSVDNGAVVSADLDNFNFNLKINSVTEDEKNYYATYSYQMLVIENGAWQNKEVEKILKVSKAALGGRDFGLYAAEELGENVKSELSYLKKVQKLEKEKGQSQKVVAVEYSGLIGKLLNPKEKIIAGYNPVIPEAIPEPTAAIVSTPSPPPPAVSGVEPPVVSGPVPSVVEGVEPSSPPAASAEPTPTTEPAPEATSTPSLTETPISEPATSTPEIVTTATSTPPAQNLPEADIEAGPPACETCGGEPVVEATSTLPTPTESGVGTPTSTPSSIGTETAPEPVTESTSTSTNEF